MNRIILLLSLSLLAFNYLAAQKDAPAEKEQLKEYVSIKILDGSTVKGEMLEMNDEFIIVKTDAGELKVDRANVEEVKILNKDPKESRYRDFADSYFLLPSARPVGKGNNHYKNFNVFFNQFNFGLSDNFSVGVGFESISFFAGNIPVTYVQPKFSLGSDKSYVGIGTTLFIVPFDGGAVGGLAYLNYTYGTDNKNLTLGASLLYTTETSDTSPLIFNVNFMYPLNDKISFMSEIVFGDFDAVLFDLGIRIKTKSGISFDAGLIRTDQDQGSIIGYPLLGIAVPLQG